MSDGVTGRVVVCIPTFRRSERLLALLEALDRQRCDEAFDVVVGNNDPQDAATLAVLAAPPCERVSTLAVAEKGVSAVRNAMISDILARDEPVEWIACIDDDQLPDDDWLAELVSVGRRWRADVVGGPVRQTPAATTFWAAAATDTSYLPSAEGPVSMLNEGGNLLLGVAFLRRLDRPPFRTEFGRSGGEDYEFFRYAASRGARLFWAPNARVAEIIPPARLSFRGLVWRSYSTAASQARADRLYGGAIAVLASVCVAGVKAPLQSVRSLRRDRDPRKAVALLVRALSAVAGRVSGLVGLRAERYGAD